MVAKAKRKRVKDELANKTAMGADGVERDLSKLFELDDFDESKEKDQIFVRHDALLRVAKKTFGGLKSRIPHVLQTPLKSNDWCATVEVVYTFRKPVMKIGATGDCRSGTARQMFKSYTTALAETRASARALRFAIGIEMVTHEEITNIDEIVDAQAKEPATDSQKNMIKKRFLSEKGGRTMEEIAEIIGEKKVVTLDQLTRGHAADVLEAFQE